MEQQEDRALVRFTVRDTGIGIDEDMQGQIFKPFEQGSAQITGKFGGTGLGLAISRRIVQLFGGDIQLDSTMGAGSTFSFQLWLRETSEAVAESPDADSAQGQFGGKRMLLVDDVELNRVIVKAMMEETGIAIDEARDGFDAVEKFKQSEIGAYDIIFMDVQMPEMDGYQAAAAIRATEREDAASTAIIALTANAFKEDIDKAIACGMNAHLAKPVEMKSLLCTMNRFLDGEGKQQCRLHGKMQKTLTS